MGPDSHGKLVNTCCDLLEEFDYLAFPQYAPRRRGRYRNGTPDILAVDNYGFFLAVECKTGKDKLSTEQDEIRLQIDERATCLIVRDIEELREYLEDELCYDM